MSNLRITATNPATLGSRLDLDDEKKPDDGLRVAYERLCADLKANFPGIQAEYFAPPPFEEFKQACMEDGNA